MKKNLFPLCLLFLLCAAALCGCAEDDEPIAATDGTILTIHATADGFTSAEGADTRATESGYTTTFTTGDEIGVFAVKNGAVIAGCRNVKCTYNAGNNTWNASAPVYYYKDAQYFAYYPYKDELSSKKITSVNDIVDYFNENIATKQGTYADYTDWDLMAAAPVSPATKDQPLSFSFAHKMSLIEISLSAMQNYKTSDKDDAYKYSALTPITTDATFSITKDTTKPTSITPYNMGRGVYRYILPANTTCTIEGEFSTTDNKTIKYSKTVSPLSPSNYKRLNVTYDGSSSTVTVRALAIGDYYYSDGNIVPGDTPNPPKEDCIGIVFWLGNATEKDKTLAKGHPKCTHGLVVALTEYQNVTWQSPYNMYHPVHEWLNNNQNGQFLPIQSGIGSSDPLNNIQGYNNTKAIEVYNGANFDYIVQAVSRVDEYRKTAPAPDNSSDWYLPSEKELALLCGKEVSDIYNNTPGTDNKKIINNKLKLISGATELSSSYWSSTEPDSGSSTAYIYAMNFSSGKVECYCSRNKNRTVRYVLAF